MGLRVDLLQEPVEVYKIVFRSTKAPNMQYETQGTYRSFPTKQQLENSIKGVGVPKEILDNLDIVSVTKIATGWKTRKEVPVEEKQ